MDCNPIIIGQYGIHLSFHIRRLMAANQNSHTEFHAMTYNKINQINVRIQTQTHTHIIHIKKTIENIERKQRNQHNAI